MRVSTCSTFILTNLSFHFIITSLKDCLNGGGGGSFDVRRLNFADFDG